MTSGLRSKFARLVRERLVRRLLPDSITANVNRNDRWGALHRAWGHVITNRICGAYYEFGVYRGESFRVAYHAYRSFLPWVESQTTSAEAWRRQAIAAYASHCPHFYAFDTFEGIPDNAEGEPNFTAGNFLCPIDEFRRLNEAEGLVEGKEVRYFVGRFDEVLVREAEHLRALQPAAIVNIDSDLYESAMAALRLVKPKLRQGSVLLFDDWNTFSARRTRGERRALAEWLKANPEFSIEPWFPYQFCGQAFLVHTNDESTE